MYQEQTKKAVENFPFTYRKTAKELIYAIVEIKKAAAKANARDKGITEEQAQNISHACDEILAGTYDDQFVTCALQGGAGTSINMNANEVIASLANVHPLDQVNKSQSTNDVNPSGLKIACYRLLCSLEQTVKAAAQTLKVKSSEWATIPKLGRTHLQDAIPTTVGSEFESYAAIVERHLQRIVAIKPYLLELNLGGTAIGNAVNASETYRKEIYKELSTITHLPLTPLPNLMSGTSSQTDFVAVSQLLVSLYIDLSKIASDIRLLVSGPNGGLGELTLPAFQKGSSIMPGKVNPVSAEMVNQTYYLLNGYEVTIEHAAHGAQLELGVMFPILADTLISSLILSREVLDMFTKNCLSVLEVNRDRCLDLLNRSTAYATILTPLLGYDIVSEVVHQSVASNKTIIEVLKEKNLYSEDVQKILHQS